jgi:hypothetical protein
VRPQVNDVRHGERQHRDASPESSFERLGRFNARHAWWVIGCWALLQAAAMPLLIPIQSRLSQGGFPRCRRPRKRVA